MAMADWRLEGEWIKNCNCAFGCPCDFNAPPTHGSCKGLVGMRITKGNFEGTKLDGLMFAATVDFPGPLHEGNGKMQPIDLGEFIVADPHVCHGKPTIKGTRIMVWQILDELAHGMSPAQIVKVWGGKVSRPAVAECVGLAKRLLLTEEGRLRHPSDLRRAA